MTETSEKRCACGESIAVSVRNGSVLLHRDDAERIAARRWFIGTDGYARRSIRREDGRRSTELMHRVVANTPAGYMTDHRDRDRANNCRCNLRAATPSENCMNGSKRKDGRASRYRGVGFHAFSGLWIARVGAHGKSIHLGYFKDELDAAAAYDRAALIHHGAFARINFPPEIAA